MNKKRKIILNFWIIFILIILLILLLLLGLRLPKLFKSIQDKNKVETQYQYQTQYIYDTNKVNDIIGLINALKRLKQLKELKNKQQQTEKQKETQPINNLDFFDPKVQNDLYHELSKELDKIPQIKSTSKLPEVNQFPDEAKQTEYKYVVPDFKDEKQELKDIAVVTLSTGAVIITCSVLTPIFASVGSIGTFATNLLAFA